jgi:4-amino-4-deoxy-L-arabinose transferase-like glycosyltransferase
MAQTIGNRRGPPPPPGLSMVVDFAAASHARAVIVLVVVAFVTLIPGLFQIPPVDRDEARFAQATRQMIESGDYVDIRFQDENRYKKPVGIYWLQAAAVKVAQTVGVGRAISNIGIYRLPSFAGAVGAVLMTYWAALAFVSRRAAVLAALMLAVSILLSVEARLAKTDAALLAACVAAMGALGRAYVGGRGVPGVQDVPKDAPRRWLLPAIFWTAMAGGVLLKGPLIFMFVGLAVGTLAAADRSVAWLSRLKPVVGVAWMFVLVLPWFAAIVSRSGWTFFTDSLGRDLFAKVGAGQESHGMPPGFYLALFWVTFFPGSLLVGLAMPAIWHSRAEIGAKFLLAWIVPSWIVFEVVATKLPHYVLPLYPAIAIIVAGVVDHHSLSRRLWLVRGTVWWFLITAMLVTVLIAAHVAIEQQLGFLAWPFGAAATIFSFSAWWLFIEDGAERSLLRASVAAILISICAFGATIPQLPALFPAMQISRYLRGASCTAEVATAGYHEPSLVFLAGTATQQTDGTGAADFLLGGGCRYAVVEKGQERAFVLRADNIGLRYARGLRIEGVNIGSGRRVSMTVFRSEPR